MGERKTTRPCKLHSSLSQLACFDAKEKPSPLNVVVVVVVPMVSDHSLGRIQTTLDSF